MNVIINYLSLNSIDVALNESIIIIKAISQREKECLQNRSVLIQLIDIILSIDESGIPFRGHYIIILLLLLVLKLKTLVLLRLHCLRNRT